MRGLSRLLLILGIVAIPLWYIYRTLEEKRVRHLEWPEVFMTEEARQQKWAEEKRKAKEAEEAKKVEAATKLAEATAQAERERKERKDAEAAAEKAHAEAEEARARAIHAQNEREEQLARERLAEERVQREAAASRARVEAEKMAKQHAVAAALGTCAEKAARAEAVRVRIQSEQRAFQSFYEEASKISLPADGPTPRNIEEVLEWTKHIHRADFAAAFRMLSAREALKVSDSESLKAAKENCDAAAVSSGDQNSFQFSYALSSVDSLNSQYLQASETLRRLRSDLTDLIDYAGGKLGASVGDEVKRARVQQTLERARYWKEKP